MEHVPCTYLTFFSFLDQIKFQIKNVSVYKSIIDHILVRYMLPFLLRLGVGIAVHGYPVGQPPTVGSPDPIAEIIKKNPHLFISSTSFRNPAIPSICHIAPPSPSLTPTLLVSYRKCQHQICRRSHRCHSPCLRRHSLAP